MDKPRCTNTKGARAVVNARKMCLSVGRDREGAEIGDVSVEAMVSAKNAEGFGAAEDGLDGEVTADG